MNLQELIDKPGYGSHVEHTAQHMSDYAALEYLIDEVERIHNIKITELQRDEYKTVYDNLMEGYD